MFGRVVDGLVKSHKLGEMVKNNILMEFVKAVKRKNMCTKLVLIQDMDVVYFDQQMDAPHAFC